MLHQISWFTYAVSIISLIIFYYLYVGLSFYKSEIRAAIYKFSGKKPALRTTGSGDLQIPDYDIMGKAQAAEVDLVSPEELSFGPVDTDDEETPVIEKINPSNKGTDSRLIGDFSEMVSEIKTLIRVINESNESKENFEMLFRLITQKYPSLSGSVYRQQINEFLLTEGAPEFPFSLTAADLEIYWTIEI